VWLLLLPVGATHRRLDGGEFGATLSPLSDELRKSKLGRSGGVHLADVLKGRLTRTVTVMTDTAQGPGPARLQKR
jgi:hypothetical protein